MFVETHKILTLPATEKIQVIETPAFLRSLLGVAAFDPAPPLTPELGSFYYVTPFPKDWPKEKAESKLREYNRYTMEIISIHEAMPGHFVQFQCANQVQPESRRALRSVLGSGAYAEGWAVLAQDLMVDAGYLGDPKLQIANLKNLMRAVANSILDIRLHSRGMTDDEAMKLMTEDTFQERTEAELKLRRAKLSVTQLCTYFVGHEEWRSILDAGRKAQGKAFDQRAFLDRALKLGALPLPSLREILVAGGAGGGVTPSTRPSAP
jgi:uncharacterized protein (DUF885 family)